MKTRLVVVTLVLLSFTVFNSYGQGLHLGIKGGTDINKISGQSFNEGFKFGYSLGGFVNLDVTKKVGIQGEVNWSQSNTTTSDNFTLIYSGFSQQNITLNYLTIPIMLTFRPIPLISFMVGPQYGILLGQPNNLFLEAKNSFKSGDFSVLGGAQVNLGAFRAGARYVVGLNNLCDLGSYDNWKSQGFQLYVGLKIF
jgi:hypothetical protein